MTGNAQRGGGRIVVGVDGTAASPIAVRWAVQEALLRQASVHLVFVARQYPRASYSGSPDVSPSVEDDAERPAPLAAAELEAGRTLPPDRLSSELVAGSPDKVLIDRWLMPSCSSWVPPIRQASWRPRCQHRWDRRCARACTARRPRWWLCPHRWSSHVSVHMKPRHSRARPEVAGVMLRHPGREICWYLSRRKELTSALSQGRGPSDPAPPRPSALGDRVAPGLGGMAG